MAARCAGVGGTVGGAGGRSGWERPSNLAPVSKPFCGQRKNIIAGPMGTRDSPVPYIKVLFSAIFEWDKVDF